MMLVVTALSLLLVSYLLALRLGAEGASKARVAWTIAELWITFAMIIAAFITARRLMGAGELSELLSRAPALPLPARLTLFGLLLIAALLFIHLLISLRPPKRPLP
jgi:hypothetical protein